MAVTTFVGAFGHVIGTSMEPTVEEGNVLVIDKLSYRFTEPKRFDVAIVSSATERDLAYIKRIIGLPGETVQIKRGYVYINGEKLEGDTYCDQKIIRPGRAREPVRLGEDEYFVLGDYRNNSNDSRSALGIETKQSGPDEAAGLKRQGHPGVNGIREPAGGL